MSVVYIPLLGTIVNDVSGFSCFSVASFKEPVDGFVSNELGPMCDFAEVSIGKCTCMMPGKNNTNQDQTVVVRSRFWQILLGLLQVVRTGCSLC